MTGPAIFSFVSYRYLSKDAKQREWWAGYVRNTFRLPEHVVKRWHGQPAATRKAALEAHKAARMQGEFMLVSIAQFVWLGIRSKAMIKDRVFLLSCLL